MKIPNYDECIALLEANGTPDNIIAHCKAVGQVAAETADAMIAAGKSVNKDLAVAAALLHDIERHKENHVQIGADLIAEKGYPDVAAIMRMHSMNDEWKQNTAGQSTETKVAFYADKKVKHTEAVSLDERFSDLEKRYNCDLKWELSHAKHIEEELLG